MCDAQSRVGMPVKKRLSFREEDDIALLREVVGRNPFLNPEAWDTIKQHVLLLTGNDFAIKILKDHLDLLIKLWLEKTKIITFKSGTEEDYNEKEQLCQDIYDSMSQFRNKPKKKMSKKKELENAGKVSRDEWANSSLHSHVELEYITDAGEFIIPDNSLSDGTNNILEKGASNLPDHEYCNFSARENCVSYSNNESPVPLLNSTFVEDKTIVDVPPTNLEKSKVLRPIRARKRKINVQRQGLSYLEQYDKNQLEIRKQELLMQEKKIALEERKVCVEKRKLELAEKRFNLEEYEKKKTLELLEDRQKDMQKIIERQDNIIQMLLLQMQK